MNYNNFQKTFNLLLIFCLSGNIFAQSFDGIWESEGYGHILNISGSSADLYQVTQISNIFDETFDINNNELGIGADLMGLMAIENDQLILTLNGGTLVTFNSIDNLPGITPATNDPQINFDIFWQTYEDWCALFPIVNVDWHEQYVFYDALIDANTSDDDLFNYMAQMLSTLNDGHSYLDDEDDDDRYFEGGPEVGLLWDEYDYDMMDMIEEYYIDGQEYVLSASEQISYGIINDSIGYLAVNSMDGYDDNGNELDDNAVFANEINQALTFLQNTKGLIIDVRFNFGGYDSNSRNLANRLTPVQQVVYSKQVRTSAYDVFATPTVFSVHTDEVPYLNRPVIVLTSDATLSAADIFAIMVKELDCVTLIGETTYGILSDNYSKYLPNGWDFGISPERYLDNNGTNYEQQGIPPDIEVIGSMAAFNNNEDNILDVAIAEIFGLCSITSVSDVDIKKAIRVFPNPTNDLLQIELELSVSNEVTLTISDVLGRTIVSSLENGVSGQNKFEIDVRSIANGFYFLTIESGGRAASIRFSVLK